MVTKESQYASKTLIQTPQERKYQANDALGNRNRGKALKHPLKQLMWEERGNEERQTRRGLNKTTKTFVTTAPLGEQQRKQPTSKSCFDRERVFWLK